MAIEPKHIPFDEFASHLQALFDEAERDGQPVVVERAGKLFTLRPPKPRRRKRSRGLPPDDPMWSLMGAGSSGEPNNHVSRDIHRYVAEAIASHTTSMDGLAQRDPS